LPDLYFFQLHAIDPCARHQREAGDRLNNFAGIWERWLIFEKPVDFDALRTQLSEFLQIRRKERRSEVRVRLRIPLRITGTDRMDGRLEF